MKRAYPSQAFQDWLTQQWVIVTGRKFEPKDYPWLIGPFGNLKGIGEEFIHEFAEKENLTIDRNVKNHGLIPSFKTLNLTEKDLTNLSQKVIDFYENTANYNLDLEVNWNPFFKVFGILINKLFSKRMSQLHIPTKSTENAENLKSELITLLDPITNEVKHTIWLRTVKSTGQVIYSGVYGTCNLPSGQTCVKAVFPLPNGNATVIMSPFVNEFGALVLDASGKKFGQAGFYFLLKNAKGTYWSKYLKTFRDKLIIGLENDNLVAKQKLTLWKLRVLSFGYTIELKK